MGSNNEDDTSNAAGGETSADYMISESGKQTETKGKKSVLDSATDKIKEKVAGAGKSVKEAAASTVGREDADDKTRDLDSAQIRQGRIGDAASDPKTSSPTENLREKAAKTIDESEDSEEPA